MATLADVTAFDGAALTKWLTAAVIKLEQQEKLDQ